MIFIHCHKVHESVQFCLLLLLLDMRSSKNVCVSCEYVSRVCVCVRARVCVCACVCVCLLACACNH